MTGPHPGAIVVLAGVSAALHVGKLAPALPVLRETFDMTLVQAGFLLSFVQLAGMTLGLVVGLAADGIGLRRTMACGLLILAIAGVLAGLAQDGATLILLRAVEGVGFLMATMPAPALLRRLVEPQRLAGALGLWGAYMPLGTALALALGPLVISAAGWPAWWWLLSGTSMVFGIWLWISVPEDPVRPAENQAASSLRSGIVQTLSARGPWLVALCFAMYSGQWLAVIGFLPSIYAATGWSGASVAALTAMAAAVNIVGNVVAGRALQAGVAPRTLLYAGFGAMALCTVIAFADFAAVSAPVRYVAILLFSMLGGMVPGTLFSVAVRVAPGQAHVSATVGWVQQWSSLGQFAGPPVVAMLASAAGGWQWTWAATGACCFVGIILANCIGSLPPPLPQRHADSAP